MPDHTASIAIIGRGKDAQSIYEHLIIRGYQPTQITICDHDPTAEIPPGSSLLTGEGYLDTIQDFSIIYRSPGVSPYLPQLQDVADRIQTSASLFFDHRRSLNKQDRPILIAITGTKGKSSTATLIHLISEQAGKKSLLIGNIGHPALDYIDTIKKYDLIVYELSSYMLEGTQVSCDIGIILNLYNEHHSTRHGSTENYRASKATIRQDAQHCIGPPDVLEKLSGINEKFATPPSRPQIMADAHGRYDDEGYLLTRKTSHKLLGAHRDYAIGIALEACTIVDIPYKYVDETISYRTGLPHRQEILGIYHGITRINDAIATTPESTYYALQRFSEIVQTVIVGGSGVGIYDFTTLAAYIRTLPIKHIICFPDTGEEIATLLADTNIQFYHTRAMQDAVGYAAQHTDQGKACLLSCAAPSYSLRKSFEEKGNMFRHAIESLPAI